MLQLKTGIATGLGVGKTLLLFGTVEKKAKRFHVNLLRKNGDIALHFNPRFDEKATPMHKNDEQLENFRRLYAIRCRTTSGAMRRKKARCHSRRESGSTWPSRMRPMLLT